MYRLKISAPETDLPLTEELLFAAGALSVSTEASVSYGPGRFLITALFQQIPVLPKALTPPGSPEPEIEAVTESSWKDLHLTGFTGLEAVPGIFIRPGGGSEPSPESSMTIYLDPRGAFGDGAHPTTALCLEALDSVMNKISAEGGPPPRALDAGAGTGILAIFMALKGAASVTAVDICPESAKQTEANAALNNLNNIEVINCPVGDLSGRNPWDLMAANLQSAVIESNMAALDSLLKPGGIAVISGVMNIHEETITRVISSFLKINGVLRKDEWLAFTAEKPCS